MIAALLERHMAGDAGDKELLDRVVALRVRLLGTPEAHGPTGELRALMVQPKRLALFAYLALAPRGFQRRDTLLAMFWPDLPEDRARGALRQAVYFLRHELGPDVLTRRGDDELGIDPSTVAVDAVEMERLIGASRLDEALGLYAGELLHGLQVPRASSDLQQWLDVQRARYRTLAAGAAMALAELRQRDGDAATAVRWARWASTLMPEDEGLVRRVIGVLDGNGDRFGALATYEELRRRLHSEFGVEPSAETERLVADVRRPPPGSAPAVAPAAASSGAAGGERASSSPSIQLQAGATPTPDESSVVAVLPSPTQLPLLAVTGRDTRAPAGARVLRRMAASVTLAAVAILLSLFWRRSAADGLEGATLRPGAAEARRLVDSAEVPMSIGDVAAARTLLIRATERDSTLAIAAARAALLTLEHGERRRLWGLALRHLATASTTERLQVQLEWSRIAGDPSALAYADSLVALAPGESWSHLQLARTLFSRGDPAASLPSLREAARLGVQLDAERGGACRACAAWTELVDVLVTIDSADAADQVLSTYANTYPDASVPRARQAWFLARRGRGDEARRALRLWHTLTGEPWGDPVESARFYLVQGFADSAERVLGPVTLPPPDSLAQEVWWLRVVTLRNRGKMEQALVAADHYASLASARSSPEIRLVPRAATLLESGRPAESGAIYRSIATILSDDARWIPSSRARLVVWSLTRAGTADAAGGNTRALEALADSVEQLGRASYYERDRRLHHYLRANLLAARGDTAGAIEAYRRSLWSPTVGYTRANLELARLLLASGRPAEAVPVARAAVEGAIDASNYYVTQTELRELLAQAHDAAGQPDSAAAHYRLVEQQWNEGDAPFRARARAAGTRARVLQQRPTPGA